MQNDLLTRAGRLEAYASQDPTNAALLHDLATTYHGAGHHEQALEVLDRVQSVGDAASPALDALRGQVLLALGRWDDASDLFAKALQVQPDSAPLLFNLAYAVWASEKDPRRAVSLFERAVGLDGSNLRFRHHLALALEAAGDPDGAIAALEQALAMNRGTSDRWPCWAAWSLMPGTLTPQQSSRAAASRRIPARPLDGSSRARWPSFRWMHSPRREPEASS